MFPPILCQFSRAQIRSDPKQWPHALEAQTLQMLTKYAMPIVTNHTGAIYINLVPTFNRYYARIQLTNAAGRRECESSSSAVVIYFDRKPSDRLAHRSRNLRKPLEIVNRKPVNQFVFDEIQIINSKENDDQWINHRIIEKQNWMRLERGET